MLSIESDPVQKFQPHRNHMSKEAIEVSLSLGTAFTGKIDPPLD